MRRLFAAFLIGVSLLASTTAQDQDVIADLTADGARISRANPRGNLTGPSALSREGIVAGFLRQGHGHDAATAASLSLVSQDASDRRVHLRFRQRIAGLDVFGTYVRATLTPSGEVTSLMENLAPAGAEVQPALIDYRDALEAALRHRYPGRPVSLPELTTGENSVTYARGDRFSENPTVTRVIVPLRGGRLRVGYLVETWDVENQLWHTVVGGGGRVVHEAPLTASENYRVYYPHPGAGPAVIHAGPGAGYVLSQSGWVFTNTTTGNNVDAYLDVAAPNGADDAGSRPVADASGHFLATADLTQLPGTAANRAAGVTNLFYMNNLAHDWLYAFGFNEASGNFQENNFGLGGLGSDSVNAEAQDYSGLNNANFATPLDGSNPRMQMYLWTFPNPDRDADLDADIIFHEYGHGLTNRMVGVGTMSGKLSGAIGEGMSDVLAVYLTLDDRIGEYSFGSSGGIRRNPYFDYTRTYGNVTGGSVHADGEIYAAAMSRLLLLWTGTGRDYIHLWLYMIDGLNYTPPFPAYEDMRDGILASMISFGLATAQDRCVVWDAFASYGIGHSANGTLTPFSVSQAFDRAPECAGIPSTLPGSLTQASLKKLPRARVTADIQRVLRYRGSPAAPLATTVIADAARRRATVARGVH